MVFCRRLGGLHAVILERNKLVGRKIARLFVAAGATAEYVEQPSEVPALLRTANVLCGDAFDADFIADQVRAHTKLRGVLWTAEPLRRCLRHMTEGRIDHVLARRDFESPPRTWEILMVARRLLDPTAPPLSAFLDWGYSPLELAPRSTADRDAAVAKIQDRLAGLQLPKRSVELVGELAHELLMNAMYDAPVDGRGRPKYAGDRKAAIMLTEPERPTVKLGTDGTRLALQVRDPFGGLERVRILDALTRGLAGGELDRSHGGAGLGLTLCHNASSALFFDIARGRYTEVTALVELDLNQRELRTSAKSLHVWSAA